MRWIPLPIQRVVEAGLVEPRGERKNRVWHLSATAYRRLGQKAAYVRQRGFEPLQQEQMVGEGRGAHYQPARKEWAVARLGQRAPVSETKSPDSSRQARHFRQSRGKRKRR